MSKIKEAAPKYTTEELEGFSVLKVFENRYGIVHVLPEKKVMICTLIQEYVPISQFQTVFMAMSDVVKEFSIEKFVFDKRHMRTFHQPSMEWYFVFWKKEMLELGLKLHRKVMPEGAPWFQKAVEAGRAKIMKEYQKDLVLDQLDIQYKDTLAAAIEE